MNVGGQEGACLSQSLCLTGFLGLGSVLYPSSEERGDIDLSKQWCSPFKYFFFPERSSVLMIWSRVAGRIPKGQSSDTTSGRLRLKSMKERQTQCKKAEGASDMKLGGSGEKAYLEPGVQSGQWPCPVCALSL